MDFSVTAFSVYVFVHMCVLKRAESHLLLLVTKCYMKHAQITTHSNNFQKIVGPNSG